MDKKKKIIIGIVVIIIIGMGIIGISYNNKNNESKETSGKVEENLNEKDELIEDSQIENQNESKPSNGVSLDVFESNIKELGYQKFDDKSYDLIENQETISVIEILVDKVVINLNNKISIENKNIKSSIELLIPNEADQIFSYIKENNQSVTMSLDNRTISIEYNEDKISILISK